VVVMRGAGMRITATTRLDGFTVTGGSARGPAGTQGAFGGGVLCLASDAGGECSPVLENLIFRGNHALRGGALHVIAYGGGPVARPVVSMTVFQSNTADYGAALYVDADTGSTAAPRLVNVVALGNQAANSGGALFHTGSGTSVPQLTNVTLFGNRALFGSAVYNAGVLSGVARAVLTNTLIWGNIPPTRTIGVSGSGGGRSVTSSLVQGGFTGTNVMDANPLFVNAAAGDLRLLPGSPALDAGTNVGAPTRDVRDFSRPANGVADPGARLRGCRQNRAAVRHSRRDASNGCARGHGRL
jgi:hypothetical protein